MTAQGVHAATCHSHVAEQQLNHRHGADVLRADRVLRPAQRIQERCGFIVNAGFGDIFAHLQEVSLRRPTDIFNHVWRVAGDVRFQQIPHATRMGEGGIAFREAVFIQLVVPAGFIIFAFFGVITGEQAIFEAKIFPHDQAGVGVGLCVFTVIFFVSQQVQQHA
ncbi:hypothetical protein D3C75_714540 [compost metagenome]